MATVKLSNVFKIYPNGFHAVKDFNLDIKDKEFVIFVGPSGCGKSTTMRMVAGLEEISKGSIEIGGKIVNDFTPKERNVAMVFQDYALYPHMTVEENMSLGLKLKRVPKNKIREKVVKSAEILGLENLLNQYPRQLSGGQRQRVALGRAIVRSPNVFMFDEPLSNLDPKLRTTMRVEIKKLHQRLDATMIYVTHDQIEAMTLGDRIVVMDHGEIQQIDDPVTLYNYPGNQFVAGFIGSPPINFFRCDLIRSEDKFHVQNERIRLLLHDKNSLYQKLAKGFPGSPKITAAIRAEDMSVTFEPDDKESENIIKAKVDLMEPVGSEIYIHMKSEKDRLHIVDSRQVSEMLVHVTADEHKSDNLPRDFIVRDLNLIGNKINRGDQVNIKVDLDKIHLFDTVTERAIR